MKRLLFCVAVGISTLGPGHAQVLDHPVTVPVAFEGQYDSDGSYDPSTFELSLAGATASASGYNDDGWIDTGSTTAHLRPGKAYDMWISGDGVQGFRVHFNPPSGYRVYIEDELGRLYPADSHTLYGWSTSIKVRVDGGDALTDAPAGDSTGLNPGRTVWQVGLGRLKNGRGAGSITLREDGISTDLGTRSVLFYDSACTEVEVILQTGGALRQVYANQALVDIVDETDGLYLKFYPRGAYTKVNGVYDVSAQSPFMSYRLTKNSSTQFTITKFIGSKQWHTRIDRPNNDQWNLTDWTENLSAPVRREERAYSYSGDRTYEDIVVKDGAGTAATTLRREFRDFGGDWGKELVKETHGYGTVNLVTEYAYHENAWPSGGYRKLAWVKRPDGSWSKFDYYDDLDRQGMLKATYAPFMDDPATPESATSGNCRYTSYNYTADHTGKYTRLSLSEEWTNGYRTGKSAVSYQDVTVNGLPVVVATRSDYADPNNARVTVSKTFRSDADSANHWYPSLPHAVETASGQRKAYAYTRGWFNPSLRTFTPNPGDAHVQEVVIHGSNSAADGVPLTSWAGQTIETVYVVPNKSYLEERIHTSSGTIIYRGFRVANASGSFVHTNGVLSPYQSGRWIQYEYDDYGRYHNQWTWADGRLSQHEDENGVVTTFLYDNFGRVTQQKKLSGGNPSQYELAVDLEYDGDHRLRYRREGAAPRLTSEWFYDQAGRLTSVKGPNANAVTVSYPSAREVRSDLPGPITELGGARYTIEERYRDGSFKRRTGNAAPPAFDQYFQDISDPLHGRILRHQKRSESTTDEWRNTWFDWLGRAAQQFEPTYLEDGNPQAINVANFFYCGCGRLERTTNTSNLSGTLSAPMLYQYDAMGNLSARVVDIDQNGLVGNSTRDRIEKHDTSFQTISGAWWLVEKASTYPKVNDAAERRLGETRTKLSGFSSTQVSVVQSIDAAGNTTQAIVYVDRANKRRYRDVTYPGASNTEQTIWVNGLLYQTTSRTGATATREYDTNGRLTKVQGRNSVQERFTYHAGTYLVHQKLNASFVTDTFSCDVAGRVSVHYDALGKAARYGYDAQGNVSHVWGAAVSPVKIQYNAYGRRQYMWTYQGGSNWDAADWPTATTGAGNQTTWEYQAKTGLLTGKKDANNKWVHFAYNLRHQLAQRTEERDLGVTLTTNYVYWENQDANSPSYYTGELKTVDYTDGVTTDLQFEYDRLGRPKKVADETGWREFAYQDDDPNAGAGIYANLQLTEEILPGFYNALRLTRRYETAVKGRYTGYDFGPSGSPTFSATYGYETATGRLRSVQAPYFTEQIYGYLSNSDLVASLTADSWQRTTTWNSERNLPDAVDSTWSGASRARYDYTYDNNGRRLSAKQSGSAFDGDYGEPTFRRFTYNDRGEVTQAFDYLGANINDLTRPLPSRYHAYTYDTAGNRTSSNHTGVGDLAEQYSTNALNQYTSKENNAVAVSGVAAANSTVALGSQISAVGQQGRFWSNEVVVNNTNSPWSGAVTAYAATSGGSQVEVQQRGATLPPASQDFTYDYAGNLKTDEVWSYTYDAENRLIATENLSSLPAGYPRKRLEFKYDYIGRRVQKVVKDSGGTVLYARRFVYDGWNLIGEYNAPSGTSFGSLLRSYTWGLDIAGSRTATGGVGALVQFTDHAHSNKTYVPAYDANGNVAAMVNRSDGAVAAVYEYNPFGEPLRAEALDSDLADQPLRFSTKYTDMETGLVYYGYRYYSPSLGRFVNRDPIMEAGGANLYHFAGNDSVNRLDVLGLVPEREPTGKDDVYEEYKYDRNGNPVTLRWVANCMSDDNGCSWEGPIVVNTKPVNADKNPGPGSGLITIIVNNGSGSGESDESSSETKSDKSSTSADESEEHRWKDGKIEQTNSKGEPCWIDPADLKRFRGESYVRAVDDISEVVDEALSASSWWEKQTGRGGMPIESSRYVYTRLNGWIDLRHAAASAGIGLGAQTVGFFWEVGQYASKDPETHASGFNSEDFVSNFIGEHAAIQNFFTLNAFSRGESIELAVRGLGYRSRQEAFDHLCTTSED